MADKEDKKPVMDVEKPGSTPAPATSRPLIITKGPAIKDPMVTAEDSEKTDDKETQVPLPSSKKKTIQPLSEQEPKAAASEEEQPSQDTEPTQTEESEGIGPDLPAEESSDVPTKDPVDERSQEDQKRQELADKLVLEKKYFVPIGAVHKKQAARTTAVLAVLLIIVLGVLAAIDAELIETSISLPFDFL